MPLYESKGKQWAKNKPTLPIGLDPSYTTPANNAKNTTKKIPGLSAVASETQPSKSKKKKKKKSDSQKIENTATQLENLDISSKALNAPSAVSLENATKKSQPTTTDPAKRIRNLKKKLRDIQALKLKIESGELPNPEKDQLEKIARKEEIEAEIEELELDLEIA